MLAAFSFFCLLLSPSYWFHACSFFVFLLAAFSFLYSF
jgi:hypothetical protein